MHFLHPLASLPLALSLATAVTCATPPKPHLTYALTVTVDLGLPVGPITVDGGKDYSAGIVCLNQPSSFQLTRAVEPITGGNITGIFKATISGGAATISVTNVTVARPSVEIWGVTDDGEPFIATGTGIGAPGKQLATVVSWADR